MLLEGIAVTVKDREDSLMQEGVEGLCKKTHLNVIKFLNYYKLEIVE